MCGVVGIVSTRPVAQSLYNALTVLQHRGQDAAGIVTWSEEGGLKARKSNGLVRDVFRQRHMERLQGHVGIAHVRYPTAGGSKSSEAQPFYVNSPYGICLAHNGNLTNADEIKRELFREDRRHINTDSDSEILLNVFAHELGAGTQGLSFTHEDVFRAVSGVHRRCRGGYAAVAMIPGYGVIGFRDPNGIRPLTFGVRDGEGGPEMMVASESVALDTLGISLEQALEQSAELRARADADGQVVAVLGAGLRQATESAADAFHGRSLELDLIGGGPLPEASVTQAGQPPVSTTSSMCQPGWILSSASALNSNVNGSMTSPVAFRAPLVPATFGTPTSAAMSRTTPHRPAPSTRTAWRGPRMSRAAWGAIRPTKPIGPARLTAIAASTAPWSRAAR